MVSMEHLTWTSTPEGLRQPIMVCAFRGWNDAASSATTALTTYAESLVTTTVAEIDPEDFFDFQANRPLIKVADGSHRRIEWPTTRIFAAYAEAAERDLVLVEGVEPSLKWRTFSETILEVAERLGVGSIVMLGSLVAEVAHTLPVPVTGLASDPDMVARLKMTPASYEGPTGIVGVLHDVCRREGIESASLWAAIPHYVAAIPSPKAALALTERIEILTGVAADNSGLEAESGEYEAQIGRAVEADSEIGELVTRIEEQQRSRSGPDTDVPSGDSIAREFQRFLRQREGD